MPEAQDIHPERARVSPAPYAAAAARITPYVRRTPLLTARVDGREVSLKLENLQVAGVFKIRGALNALLATREAATAEETEGIGLAWASGGVARLGDAVRSRGSDSSEAGVARPRGGGGGGGRVVTASGGNHGLGVATAARWLGIPATVYVPATVPDIKAARIDETGADVVRAGRVFADAERAARQYAAEHTLYYVHAYDDPAVVAGQGTLALEIVTDFPDCDVVAVPVGGGGLLAGVSGALAAIDREALSGPADGTVSGGEVAADGPAPRRVVGVEPEGCPTLHAAVAAGGPVDVGADSVAASALGAARIGDLAFAAYRANPVGLALVTDKEILSARDRLWEEFRLAVEPAAATVFAAWLSGQVPGAHPCLVLSGANAAWTPA